ncbi:TylF/MycF/NovP-related O-methyltransferase [Clostridium botulinum]|uniref:TylF/MycF/NovP-related O-methyltransferase n=1 Tax=Clostridium botulinum TaxID=1491 RepID=UPI0006A40B0B|nr:TylF/MycF/NovP-related O-methyltransferase [Clostridium botulinum]KOC31913.1 crotonobetainyl-CoA:carnitine CoA-transferase [Clostridium botulinum]
MNITGNSNIEEKSNREKFYDVFTKCPIPSNEVLSNLGLFISRQSLSRILFMNELYKKIIDVHGSVIEFGVRWGQNLALFESFRGMYEPFNYNRKIIGFDTFSGFTSIDEKDGNSSVIIDGAYSVSENYEEYLEEILKYHESESPISHIKKYELIKGDATVKIHEYLEANPETIIALAYFDFDIYKPTKECLQAIKSHLTKGSIIGFDELNYYNFPGETLALKEVLGLDKYRIQRSPLSPLQSYIIIE